MINYAMKWTFLFAFLSGVAWGEERIEVRLMDTAYVEAPWVSLGEVSIIHTESQESKEALSALRLDRAPDIDRAKVLSAYRIRSLLHQEGYSNIRIYGKQTTVTTRESVVEREELQQAVEKWVDERTIEGTEVSVVLPGMQSNWRIPHLEEAEIVVAEGNRRISPVMNLLVQVKSNGELITQENVRVEVALYREMPLIARSLSRGEILQPEHIEMRRVEVTMDRGNHESDPVPFYGMAAERDLAIGEMISDRDFSAPIVMERGEEAKIIVVNGEVTMTLSGAIATQDAREGEIVKFINPMNRREPLRAKVVRSGVAVIHLQ